MPETTEGQSFDELGICRACSNSEEKMHINWIKREQDLKDILDEAKKKAGNNYDCVLPISGGKDSTFQMHILCKIYKMKPLAVTFNHNWYSEIGWYNLMNSLEVFNVDHIMFTPNRGLVNRLAKKSLYELGDPCWHCHFGCGSFPLQVAVKFNIPLIIYGESSMESYSKGAYSKPVLYDREYFLKTSSKKIPDEMVDNRISTKDVYPLNLPSAEEYEKSGIKGIHLGNYIFWDEERQTEFVKKEYGWKEAGIGQTYKGYKSDECIMPGVHDYTCYLKRGFSRATFHASNDVRQGLLNREEGFDLIRKFEPVEAQALHYFLEITDMSRDEFYEVMKSHRMKPLKNVDVPVYSDGSSSEKAGINPVKKELGHLNQKVLPFMQQLIEKHKRKEKSYFVEINSKDSSTSLTNMGSFFDFSIGEILSGYKKKEISPVDIAKICIEKFEVFEAKSLAWEVYDPDKLLEQAKAAENRLHTGEPCRILEGIPVGIKDIFNTKDFPTQMGSPIYKGFTPGNDARVVFYLREAGAIIPGKTTTAEFAVDALSKTLNPYDPSRTPGTSSSGSAVAIAMGMVPASLGTQTAGSIIRPASFCGIYGYKPSFGIIPRTAMLKTTDSLDTVGFFTLWYKDLQRLFETLRVRGHNYPFVHEALSNSNRQSKLKDQPWRAALIRPHVWHQAEDYAKESLLDFVKRLEKTGEVEIIEAELPKSIAKAHNIHKTIYDKSLAHYFAEEYKQSDLISSVMNARIENGLSITPEDYHVSLKDQETLIHDMDEFLKDFDVMITLSTAGEAPLREIEEKADSCLIWTLTHLPVINAPVFKSPAGLPFGLQIISRRYNDYRLFKFVDFLLEVGLVPERPNPINE